MDITEWARSVRSYALPHAAERDPGFQREIQRLSVLALYVIAGVTLCMPLVASLFHFVASIFEPVGGAHGLWWHLAFVAIAGSLLGAVRTRFGRSHARKIALAAGFACAAVLTWGTFALDPSYPERVASSVTNLIIVMLVGVAAIPAWPVQIFLLGSAITTFHWLSARMAVDFRLIEPVSLHIYAGLDAITLLCTALAAVNYQRLVRAYKAHQSEMESQSRLLVSEHAATLGRFAATLSHELNNPLGVAASTLDSLEKVEQRSGGLARDAERDDLRRQLFEAARTSLLQLSVVLERMRRLTNLDRAEKLPVDLCGLLNDVTAMFSPELRKRIRVETPSKGLPPLTLKPQEISAVLARLLERALEVSGPAGQVELSARRDNSHVEITVTDQGQPLDNQEQESLFEPGFTVRGSRVAADWGLFSARRAVREHGGEIEVCNRAPSGSAMMVRLPLR